MNHYSAFIKVLETGSFTKAADELGYTQSAISQMIHVLEKELNTTLLVRSKKKFDLTMDGEKYLPFIQNIHFAKMELEKKQKEVEGIESGLIRIGTISSVSCHWLPSLMYKFKKIYPNVTFELFQGEYTNISDGVMNGTIDFGFVNPHATTNLHSILLTQDEMHVILPQNHPLAKNEYIDLKTIQAEPFILLNEGDYNEVLDIFHSQGLSPNIQYNVHDDYTIMAMVEQGLGISILSNLVLTRCPYDIIKKSLSPITYRSIAIIYKDIKILSKASTTFIEFIVENI